MLLAIEQLLLAWLLVDVYNQEPRQPLNAFQLPPATAITYVALIPWQRLLAQQGLRGDLHIEVWLHAQDVIWVGHCRDIGAMVTPVRVNRVELRAVTQHMRPTTSAVTRAVQVVA